MAGSSKAPSIKSQHSLKSNTDTPDTASASASGGKGSETPASLPEMDDGLLMPPDDSQGDSETGKFKQLMGILRKAINVKDLASVRLSLPANLLEPIGNLEYWHYADRPDLFAAIDYPDDDFERMLAMLRWTFTKDLKFIKNKVAKPYNSILGEHFHSHWDVKASELKPETGHLAVYHAHEPDSTSKDKSSTVAAHDGEEASITPSHRVVYLTEQTSHHPPISHFYYECRPTDGDGKGNVIATGADQLSARFTGTTIKVFPGEHNKGIFVRLPKREEEYQVTHPTATVAGLLRASPYATIADNTYVVCRGTAEDKKERLCALIHYVEEGWLSKPKFSLEGAIFKYDEQDEEPTEYTKIKQIPSDRLVATFEGSWKGDIRWFNPGDKTPRPLIDLTPLNVVPKKVKPIEQQDELETRRVWEPVTSALLAKDWSTATKAKRDVEQRQRDKAAERKANGEVYCPTYFVPQPGEHDMLDEDFGLADSTWDGRPSLTETGRQAVEEEFAAKYSD